MIFYKAVPINDIGEPWNATPEPIHGYETITWVERYREAGSIEITAPVSAGMEQQIPVGTLISHSDTLGYCMIESHEYEGDEEGLTFKAVGRSLEAWLTYRVVGEFEAEPPPNYENGPPSYILTAAPTWEQVTSLIQTHALGSEMQHLKVGFVQGIQNDLVYASPPWSEKAIERQSVYETLLPLLKLEDLGIKVVRGRSNRERTTLNSGPMDDTSTYLVIHAGKDRTREIVFSFQRGDITDLNYLESNELNINHVSVVGRYGVVRVTDGALPSKYWRRSAVVSADVDKDWDGLGNWARQRGLLADFGQRAIRNNSGVQLMDAKFGENMPYAYGVDYNIGDLVLLKGEGGMLEFRRITEHTVVVSQDEVTEIPTFSVPGAE